MTDIVVGNQEIKQELMEVLGKRNYTTTQQLEDLSISDNEKPKKKKSGYDYKNAITKVYKRELNDAKTHIKKLNQRIENCLADERRQEK